MFGFAEDRETDELHKKATALKKDGLINEAIDVLYQVKERMLVSEVCYQATQWTRLPKFLQMAGRFNEAIKELEFLISDIDRRLDYYNKGISKNIINRSKNFDLAEIYKAMSLIYKRENKKEESLKFEQLSYKYADNAYRSLQRSQNKKLPK
ncbi:hypothetical protein [Sulfuricurvum sp.]|uniref:hypothetical protein n=1 Tax=Sulfuricurvum sp. TaxID=2025608 RepID=UPI002618A24B|nr:hypothetical protein [Sulfuricurvum sp.]MDD4884493.1 hypothetical protein [Sulfuricurvum sp.]